MRGKEVNAPELEQNNALGRTERQHTTNHRRHARKCAICNHPDRPAIEFDFLNWRNPFDLVKSYRFRGLSTIYRHAHATGLFAKRRLNLRFAMERIVERVSEVPVTATAVIRAARAIARINDEGQWVDPPSRLIVTHTDRLEEQPPASGRAPRENGGFVGRGFSRDIKTRRAHSSPRGRRGGQGHVPGIPARDSSVVLPTVAPPIFDDALLDEPSESAAGEMPKIDGKPAAPEVILTLTPEFQRCRDERNRAIEADRRAKGEVPSAPSSPSLLPQAEMDNSSAVAPSETHPRQGTVSTVPKEPDHSSSTLPPARRGGEAAPDKPATAEQSTRAAGPPLGSSGSADPPFPFVPRVPLRHHARRHFLIENEMRSRGESND